MAVTKAISPSELVMRGQMFDGKATNGLKFTARLSAHLTGGRCVSTNNSLVVENADAVTLLLAAATDYALKPPAFRGGDPEATTERRLKGGRPSRHAADLIRSIRSVQCDGRRSGPSRAREIWRCRDSGQALI